MLNGHPITARLPEDLGIGERFWYWRGASGKAYIHSIYGADSCPPLPGAVFLAVRKSGDGRREVLAADRFPSVWDQAESRFGPAVNEIHVHLLARGESAAEMVLEDLREALGLDAHSLGFGESPAREPAAYAIA